MLEALIDRFLEFARNEATEPSQPGDPGAVVAQRVSDFQRLGRQVQLERTWTDLHSVHHQNAPVAPVDD